MATIRQKRAFEKIVENGGIVSKGMRDAKYSPETAKTPSKLTDSKGFKELCKEYGLTDQLLLTALVEDIKGKKKNRKPELELGFKIKGRLTEHFDVMTGGKKFNLTTEQVKTIAKRTIDDDKSESKSTTD